MFELSGVNYEEVLKQGDSILVRVIASSSYRGFELSGLYCILFGSNLMQISENIFLVEKCRGGRLIIFILRILLLAIYPDAPCAPHLKFIIVILYQLF